MRLEKIAHELHRGVEPSVYFTLVLDETHRFRCRIADRWLGEQGGDADYYEHAFRVRINDIAECARTAVKDAIVTETADTAPSARAEALEVCPGPDCRSYRFNTESQARAD